MIVIVTTAIVLLVYYQTKKLQNTQTKNQSSENQSSKNQSSEKQDENNQSSKKQSSENQNQNNQSSEKQDDEQSKLNKELEEIKKQQERVKAEEERKEQERLEQERLEQLRKEQERLEQEKKDKLLNIIRSDKLNFIEQESDKSYQIQNKQYQLLPVNSLLFFIYPIQPNSLNQVVYNNYILYPLSELSTPVIRKKLNNNKVNLRLRGYNKDSLGDKDQYDVSNNIIQTLTRQPLHYDHTLSDQDLTYDQLKYKERTFRTSWLLKKHNDKIAGSGSDWKSQVQNKEYQSYDPNTNQVYLNQVDINILDQGVGLFIYKIIGYVNQQVNIN